jgi:hypothetical protein
MNLPAGLFLRFTSRISTRPLNFIHGRLPDSQIRSARLSLCNERKAFCLSAVQRGTGRAMALLDLRLELFTDC